MNGTDMREKGITLNLGGKERHLIFDLNALCELEDKYKDINLAFATMVKGQVKSIRFLLTLALKHEDESLTEKQVGNMISLENISDIVKALGEAMNVSMPELNENENEKNS